jgi:hypothetical protein
MCLTRLFGNSSIRILEQFDDSAYQQATCRRKQSQHKPKLFFWIKGLWPSAACNLHADATVRTFMALLYFLRLRI